MELDQFSFRLYIAGNSPNSTKAVANLNALCHEHLPDRFVIEIIDVLCHPGRALDDGVLLTPMLVKSAPAPIRKVIGTLSQRESLLQALGLNPVAA